MNVPRSRITVLMTLTLSLLALYASLKGVLDKSLYQEVFLAGTLPEPLIAGSIAQDIISIPAALLLTILSLVYLKSPKEKIFTAILGLAWYFFYAFGLYTIQGQYTSIYLVYLTIFGLSIYSMIYGIISLNPEQLKYNTMPAALRISIIIFLLIILSILGPAWFTKITPDIANHVPANTYGVYVLDLGIVFPALGIIAMELLRKRPLSIVLAGIALVKLFTICLSWASGEFVGPLLGGFEPNYSMLTISGSLTLVSIFFLVLYFLKLKASH